MPTKRSKFYIIMLLMGFSVVFLVLILSRTLTYFEPRVMESPTAGPSNIALLDAIARHKSAEKPNVDLSTITTFAWDRLYVFESFTQPSEIAAVVGRSWRESCHRTIATSDGVTLLVFANKGQVVDCIEFPVNIADFAPLSEHEMGFSREEARFVVDDQGLVIWIGNN